MLYTYEHNPGEKGFDIIDTEGHSIACVSKQPHAEALLRHLNGRAKPDGEYDWEPSPIDQGAYILDPHGDRVAHAHDHEMAEKLVTHLNRKR